MKKKKPSLVTVFKECRKQSDRNDIHSSVVMYINMFCLWCWPCTIACEWLIHLDPSWNRLQEGYAVADKGYCWCNETLQLFCVLYSIDLISCKKDSTHFLKGHRVQTHCARITPGVSTSTAASHAVSMSLIVRIYSSCTPKISMTTLTSWMGSSFLTGRLIVASPLVTGVWCLGSCDSSSSQWFVIHNKGSWKGSCSDLKC